MQYPVLVLNANFEPLNVCSHQRALGLVLTERANLILNGRGEIHTPTASYPIPSVIRLYHMVHRPQPRVPLCRREIFRRDNYTCQYCGRQTLALTVDHVVPRHLNGLHVWTNLVTACPACNHRKGGRTIEESGMSLLATPLEPPRSARYLFSHQIAQNLDWEQFLEGW